MRKITKLQSYVIMLTILVFVISMCIAAYIDLTREWNDYIDEKSYLVVDEENGLYFETGKIIISFKDDASDLDIYQLLNEYNLEVTNEIVWKDNGSKVASLKVPVGEEKYYLSILNENPIVKSGQLNYAH